jgi:hypothetical protein
MAITAVALAVLGGRAISAQDKYAVQVPNGLAFSEIRGYETWPVVGVSQIEDGQMALKVILANPVMIDAYRAGAPGDGKAFPDGSKIVKIIWFQKKNPESPFEVMVPGNLKEVEFMEKDSKRFPDTGGWGYAPFLYDAASSL